MGREGRVGGGGGCSPPPDAAGSGTCARRRGRGGGADGCIVIVEEEGTGMPGLDECYPGGAQLQCRAAIREACGGGGGGEGTIKTYREQVTPRLKGNVYSIPFGYTTKNKAAFSARSDCKY